MKKTVALFHCSVVTASLFLIINLQANASSNCLKPRSSYQVVILPPTGGANSADRSLAKALCKMGHSVHILDYEQKSGLTTDLNVHDRLSRETLQDINDFLSENPRPTALIGASLGGLYASMAFGYSLTEQEEFPSLTWIQGVVLTVSGGPLYEILSTSDLDSVKEQRELRMRELKFRDLNDYRLALKSQIFYDPMVWAQPDHRERVLMFNSRYDSVVPSNTQEALWRAWGEPRVTRMSTNHQLSIARTYFFMEDKIDHFLKRLFPNPRTPN